jgi:hypothetical protein
MTVRRAWTLEKLLMIYGVVHFWITPNPKEGGQADQWFPLEEKHGRNTYKKNKILVLKYFACSTLGTKSSGIMVTIEGGNKWQTCRTLVLRPFSLLSTTPMICFYAFYPLV